VKRAPLDTLRQLTQSIHLKIHEGIWAKQETTTFTSLSISNYNFSMLESYQLDTQSLPAETVGQLLKCTQSQINIFCIRMIP
jgi:hypothetical protein